MNSPLSRLGPGLGPRRKHFHLAKLLRALCISGRLLEAVELLCQTSPFLDHRSYALLLQESINRKEANLGKRIHANMITAGFTCNDYLRTKLLIFYAKCGEVQVAQYLFDESPDKGRISWNALISGHMHKGLEQRALDLYRLMRSLGLEPDQFTFTSVFGACAALAMLEHGRQAHCLMIKKNVKDNIIVNTALINMYFKCSSPLDGHKVFTRSSGRNVHMWTALLSGYGQHGQVLEVLKLFNQMIEDGIRPNHVTFLALLSACSHGGLINEGWRYFSSMIKDYRIMPKGEHCATIVDMLGRAGRLNDAHEFIKKLPCKEHSVIWGALIGACRKHGNVELVKLVAKNFFKLQPENAGKYVVLANAYAAYEMWGSVADARGMVRSLGMRKDPAWSSIEIRGVVHVFLTGDAYHEQSEMIYKVMNALVCALTEAANVAEEKTYLFQ